MGLTEIILLAIGGLFFVISFFLPDRSKKEKTELSKEEIKALVDEQVRDVRAQIDDMIDETVNYSVEKAERALEKLTNEKIMAVDEFSQTVLKKISDNHQEVVFLYDMLNDKDEKLKQAVAEDAKTSAERTGTAAESKAVTDEPAGEATVTEQRTAAAAEKPAAQETASFIPFVPKHYEIKDGEAVLASDGSHPVEGLDDVKPEATAPAAAAEEKPVRKTVRTAGTRKKKPAERPAEKPLGPDEGGEEATAASSRGDYDGRKNSNDMIIRMHQEGRSNMQIAKELGLGVGEVKLVIDLFVSKKGKQ